VKKRGEKLCNGSEKERRKAVEGRFRREI